MFAPPVPPLGSRPSSAASHHPSYAHQPYDLPRSPMMHHHERQPRQRHNSFDWRPGAGLPPPPSQFDSLGDNIARGLVPSHHGSPRDAAHRDRSRSRSPGMRSPSRYDIEFDGLAGNSGSSDTSQMPMNTVAKHPKLKLEVVLSSIVFEAGGSVSGRLEITCSTSQKLRLGEIAVELEGIEELSSRDHAATQLFLYNRTLFQGEHLPPSNAVLPSAPHNGYWTARKGRTTFPFGFRLPSTAPSSVTFSGNAALKYQLKATAQTWWNEAKMVVTSRREAFVVEKWSDEFDEKYQQPVEAIGDTRLFMGGHGAVWLEAGVVEQLFWGGGQVLIRCGIKNNTKRQVAGIKVSLARRLIFPVGSADGTHDRSDKVSLEPRITEIVHEHHFKGREYEFPPNEEAVCNVAVDIPRDLRTIRKTRLFEIRIFALVSLVLGSFAKDLTVEIPIYVAHTASVQAPAQDDLRSLHPDPAYVGGRVPDRPHSSAGHHAHPHHLLPGRDHGAAAPPHRHHGHLGHEQAHFDPQMLAIEQMAAERGWSPAPVHPGGFIQMPSRPASAAPGVIQLPSSPQPFSFSDAAPGQLEWNPAATAWNPSRFLQSNAIPRSASAGPNLGFAMSAAPASPNPMQQQQQQQQYDPARHHTPQPQLQQQQQTWQHPQRSYSVSPGPTLPAIQPPSSQIQAMDAQGMMATDGSTHVLADQHRRASGPSPGPSSAEPAPVAHWSQQQQQQQTQSPAREQLARMPEPMSMPPPQALIASQTSPQQAAYALEPSGFGGPNGPMPLAGLATIEEDGESQAGTVKSMAALGTLNKPQGSPNAGSSVSRNDIEQFEAMARAEEDEEEVKRKMRLLGMVPDESAFRSASKGQPATRQQEMAARPEQGIETPIQEPAAAPRSAAKEAQSLPKPPVPSGKSQVGNALARPRASDIFATAQRAREEGQGAQTAVAALTTAATRADFAEKHRPFPSSEQRTSEREASSLLAITVRPDANSLNSVRRSSLSQGVGLSALETKLVRSTTPKIMSSPSMPIMTLANVGRDDGRSSSPLTSPAKAGSTRSRKESALRAAASAREVALIEKEQRETEEAMQRREREERRRIEEERARVDEERRVAERAKAAEVERHWRAEEDRRVQKAAAKRDRHRQEQQQREEKARKRQEEAEAEERTRRRELEEAATAAAAAEEEDRRRERREAKLAADRESVAEEAKRARDRAEASRALENIAVTTSQNRSRPQTERPLSVSVSPGQRQTDVLQHSALKKQAASRVAGWLSNSDSPSLLHTETPGTPSGSVISMLKKDGQGESKMMFPVRSPSQTRNPLFHPSTSTSSSSSSPASKTGEMAALPRSFTTANIASSAARPEGAARERTRSYVRIDEPLLALSTELRALVDGSDIKPARRAGTALRDHPISRKISTSSQVEPSSDSKTPPSAAGTVISAGTKRDRHTSLPAWPKPGLPNIGGNGVRPLPGTATLDQSSLPAADKSYPLPRRSADIFSDADREIVVPTRVEKTLGSGEASTTGSAAGAGGYDSRSARGGRGGRVASVTQLWLNIAGDTVPDASSGAHDGLSPPPSGTFKPKARRTSAVGGAPALDFSKNGNGNANKKGIASSGGAVVTSIAATFASQAAGGGGGSKPESLKSGSAPQFLNTGHSKPVFAGAVSPSLSSSSATSTSSTSTTKAERRPLPPQPSLVGTQSTPRLVRPIPQSPSSSFTPSTSTTTKKRSSRIALDSTIMDVFNASSTSEGDRLRVQGGEQVKFGGRGTTKAIGQGKLRDLKAVWGN